MTFNFQNMVKQHQTDMHFANFGEACLIVTSSGRSIESSAIIKVTEQAEASDHGIGIIVRAELAIPEVDCRGKAIEIKSTWKLTFREQTFAIESLSPPVAGFIKLQAVALSRELTHAPALDPR